MDPPGPDRPEPPLRPLWATWLQQGVLAPDGLRLGAPHLAGLAVGPHGHAAVGGAYEGVGIFDGWHFSESGSGAPTPYLAHYAPDGKALWVRTFAPGGTVRAVAMDYSDRVLVAGAFEAGVLLARFDAGAEPQWSLVAGPAAAGGWAEVLTMAVEPSNHVVIAGAFSGEIFINGQLHRSKGGTDVLLARVDQAGVPVWVHSVGTALDDAAVGVAVAPSGAVAVLTRTLASDLGRAPEHCLTRYSNDARLLWSRCFSPDKGELALVALATDGSDSILVAGRMAGVVDLGGEPLISAGESDALIARFAPDASLVFSRRIGGPGADEAKDMAMTPGGDILLAGRFRDEVDFGTVRLTSDGEADGFLALYDGSGGPMTARRLGGGGADEATHVVADAEEVLVTGGLEAPADFGVRLIPAPSAYLLRIAR